MSAKAILCNRKQYRIYFLQYLLSQATYKKGGRQPSEAHLLFAEEAAYNKRMPAP